MTAEVYRAAGALMQEHGLLQGVADEGGYWPAFDSNEEALEMLVRAIEAAGYRPGEQVGISLDIAASEFGRGGRYRLALEQRELDSLEMVEHADGLVPALPHRLDRGSARGGRPGRHAPVHRRARRPHPDHRR